MKVLHAPRKLDHSHMFIAFSEGKSCLVQETHAFVFCLFAFDFPGSLLSSCSCMLVPAHRYTSPPLQTLSTQALKDTGAYLLCGRGYQLSGRSFQDISISYLSNPSFQVCILNFTAFLSCFLYTNVLVDIKNVKSFQSCSSLYIYIHNCNWFKLLEAKASHRKSHED